MSKVWPSEVVYRRYDVSVPCCVCGEPATVDLHVGTGGNYTPISVCPQHDAHPGDPSPRLLLGNEEARADFVLLRGLPPDLAGVLRDQSILVPQDAAVFELIASWAKAPTNTASAHIEGEDA